MSYSCSNDKQSSRKTAFNVNQAEIDKFSANAAYWWDPEGPLKTLHQINPLRLSYLLEKTTVKDKKIIDIGCGGGLLAESLAKKGAQVTGIDMSEAVLEVARAHCLRSKDKLLLEYRKSTAEETAISEAGQYDMVCCFEMLEHVDEPQSIIQAAANLVKPGGHVFFSTLNRNPKAYLLAILGAEYVLKILPRGTHDYAKFIRPSELATCLNVARLDLQELRGIQFRPLTRQFVLSQDISVNYLCHATRAMSTP